ncbi:c-type cytochrome [Winslowiella toletana]|uniref:c-type cytochrome n=1 Tax=Winslowiella toletana TaxID=92490 RepID=UPI0028BD3E90|nr:cytochrome c [Winslowiella toletana]WNN45199.1 cytochrome c [Winslowiella toletana]
MMNKLVLALILASVSVPALADGDVNAGQQKSAACAACHGAQGKAKPELYPNLAGQHAAYLAQALRAYKKGDRSGGQAEVMRAFVAGLSEQDIDDLAAYYGSQQP